MDSLSLTVDITDHDHEQPIFCRDENSGLKAVIGIHSSVLGPALSRTSFKPYRTENEAVTDVLNLSKRMAHKNVLAGLDLVGGKAVVIGNPNEVKSEALLRAYGRFDETLGGRYYTARDVGTVSADRNVVGRENQRRGPLTGLRRRRRLVETRVVGAPSMASGRQLSTSGAMRHCPVGPSVLPA